MSAAFLSPRGWRARVGPRRTASVLQLEAAECGAASLAMILGFHGRFEPLDTLRTLCGVSRDGAKASALLRAGRGFGLEAKGLRAEPSQIGGLPMPLIAFVNFNHFLVVEGVSDDRVWLNDPASGRRSETMTDFAQGFTGVVLTFRPTEAFVPADNRPKVWRSVLARFAGVERALLFVFLASIALVIPGVVLPVFSRVFIDEIVVRQTHDWLVPLLVGMLLTALVRYLLATVQGEALLRAGSRMTLTTGTQLFGHMMRLPIAFFDQRFAGEVASRIDLNEGLVGRLTGHVAATGAHLLTAFFFLGAMLLYSVPMTLFLIALAAANIGLLLLSSRVMTEKYRRISIEGGKLAGARVAALKDIETFKASGAEDMIFARWMGLETNVVNGRQQIALLGGWLGFVPGAIGGLTTVAVLIWGGHAVAAGTLTLGGLVAYQTLAASFTAPIGELTGLAQELQQVRSSTSRLDDILDQPADASFAAPAVATERLPRGALTLDEVSFGYAPLDPPLIEGLSIALAPGSRVALVGASGSGKSTVGKLVAGLEQPRTGTVSVDGVPLLQWPRAALATRVAYVRQDIVLFEGSIRDNLTLWDPTLSEADVIAAAQDAQIHAAIVARPGGYDSAVAEGGGNFSGGERQRLDIARALATRPSVVILDEATSALDPLAELAVMEAIRRRGATCVVIAHRLSAIRDCDEIIVLERGQVVERGRHAELIAGGGSYARLVEA